jgi:hypothetical protein
VRKFAFVDPVPFVEDRSQEISLKRTASVTGVSVRLRRLVLRNLRALESTILTRLRKSVTFTEVDSDIIQAGDLEPLEELLLSTARDLIMKAQRDVSDDLDEDIVLGSAAVLFILNGLRKRIGEMTDTTRDELRRMLQRAEGMDEARRIVQNYFNQRAASRSGTISLTEVITIYNQAQMAAYKASGRVTPVKVYDGDFDPACQAANGQVWTVEKASANPLEHPNCVRSFTPILNK